MKKLIRNATIVNEGSVKKGHVLIENDRIERVSFDPIDVPERTEIIEAEGLLLLPGLIDDQVHFREPGLTHKGTIYTGARAAVAGGITSFMEMPNTVPNAVTQTLLQDKYDIAERTSIANYSFFMGATNDNLEEVLKTDAKNVCGIKIFMGSSTGNMLVDNKEVLSNIFANSPMLIATHCEDEATIRQNIALHRQKYGKNVPMEMHPIIRSAEACYISSSFAIELAEKYGANLHVLHISTAKETNLFRNDIPLEEKKITAEACTHHLWFTDADYVKKGSLIKWNPAVKTAEDRAAIRQAVTNGRIDILATDHAPHTKEEKARNYFEAPSGGPLVQHGLLALLELYKQGVFTLQTIVQRACHAPAIRFKIDQRGYIRPGYFADLVLVDPNAPQLVTAESLFYKCGWSPFEGERFSNTVVSTFVNGNRVYHNGTFDESSKGMRMTFNR